MIAPLKYINAISFRSEIRTEGHSPLLIIAEDYNAYYIKNTKNQLPSFSIINEFLCYYLLSLWGIPTPKIAAIQVDKEILPKTLSFFHKPDYYKNVCFGSQAIQYAVEMNEFIRITKKTDFNKIINAEDLVKLCLFDIWVENDDRKPTNPNVLFSINDNKIEIIAIDHAFTFSTLSYRNLDASFISQSYNDNLLYSDFVKGLLKYLRNQKDWTARMKNYYYLCINNCKANYEEITSNIPSTLGFTKELQMSVAKFLFNEDRNKKVLTEFYSRL